MTREKSSKPTTARTSRWILSALLLCAWSAPGQSITVPQLPPTNVVADVDLFRVDSLISGTNYKTRSLTFSNLWNNFPWLRLTTNGVVPQVGLGTNGIVTSNNFVIQYLQTRHDTAAQIPPYRLIMWYTGYGGGGPNAATSNSVWSAVGDWAGYAGLTIHPGFILQVDDGWTASTTQGRNGDGSMGVNTNQGWGTTPALALQSFTNMIIHVQTNGMKYGLYFECNQNGITSAGYVGTDVAHLRQDATNAALWGVDYVKFDSADSGWTLPQRIQNAATFEYWFKTTASALGKQVIFKTDSFGPGDPNWNGGDAAVAASLFDVWNPAPEIHNYSDFISYFDNYYVWAANQQQFGYCEMEGAVLVHNGSDTNGWSQQYAMDSIESMFSMPIHTGGGPGSLYGPLHTNADFAYVNTSLTKRPVLLYSDLKGTNATLQVWEKKCDNGRTAVLVWNRNTNATQTPTITASMLGLSGTIPLINRDIIQHTNNTWTNSVVLTLYPGAAQFFFCDRGEFYDYLPQDFTYGSGFLIDATASGDFDAVLRWSSSATGVATIRVPNHITSAIVEVWYGWGVATPLSWTNRFVACSFPKAGKVVSDVQNIAFTLNNGLNVVYCTNSWPADSSLHTWRIDDATINFQTNTSSFVVIDKVRITPITTTQ